MSRRPIQRARGPGPGGVKLAEKKDVDPRLNAVADWLRSAKYSGLHTKEAVQYEKVRDYYCLPLHFFVSPPASVFFRLFFLIF